MKLSQTAVFVFFLTSSVTSRSIYRTDLALRDADLASGPISTLEFSDLEKRKGGGGGKGGGSSGGGSGGRSGGGGSSGSGSSSSGSGSSGSSGSSRSPNAGGTTKTGSGTSRGYGGGAYYAGGASVPYTAGSRSPLGLTPFLLPLGALAFFPGIWLFGAYAYHNTHAYNYHNNTSNQNQSLPITCLCQEYSVCGCDDNGNSTYIDSLVKNATDSNGNIHNTSTIALATVNGTKGIYVNGTLSNDTTAADPSIASAAVQMVNLSGYWVMVAVVLATVSLV